MGQPCGCCAGGLCAAEHRAPFVSGHHRAGHCLAAEGGLPPRGAEPLRRDGRAAVTAKAVPKLHVRNVCSSAAGRKCPALLCADRPLQHVSRVGTSVMGAALRQLNDSENMRQGVVSRGMLVELLRSRIGMQACAPSLVRTHFAVHCRHRLHTEPTHVEMSRSLYM